MVKIYLGPYSYSIDPIPSVSAGAIPCNRLRSLTLGPYQLASGSHSWQPLQSDTFSILNISAGDKIGRIWGLVTLTVLLCLFLKLRAALLRNTFPHQRYWLIISGWIANKVSAGNAKETQERMEAKELEFGEKGTVRHRDEQTSGNLDLI